MYNSDSDDSNCQIYKQNTVWPEKKWLQTNKSNKYFNYKMIN